MRYGVHPKQGSMEYTAWGQSPWADALVVMHECIILQTALLGVC